MNTHDIKADIKTAVGDTAHRVAEAMQHGADAIESTGAAGVARASSTLDAASDRLATLAKVVGAYASLRTLTRAVEAASPGRVMLGALGLQRRPTTFARAAFGAGMVIVGAAAGFGAGVLLASPVGARARARVANGVRALLRDVEVVSPGVNGVAHDMRATAGDVGLHPDAIKAPPRVSVTSRDRPLVTISGVSETDGGQSGG